MFAATVEPDSERYCLISEEEAREVGLDCTWAEEHDEKMEEAAQKEKTSPIDCLQALEVVRHFSQQEGLSDFVHHTLSHVESACLKTVLTKPKQSKISDFFQSSN